MQDHCLPRPARAVYGVDHFERLVAPVSYTHLDVYKRQVRQRTRELGIRLALGAQRWGMVSMVVKEGLALAMAGTAIGIAGAMVLARRCV